MAAVTSPSTPVNLIRKPSTEFMPRPVHPALAVEALIGLEAQPRQQALARPTVASDFLPKVPSLSVSRTAPRSEASAVVINNKPQAFEIIPPPVVKPTTVSYPPAATADQVLLLSRSSLERQPQLPPGMIRLPQLPHPAVSVQLPVVQLPKQPVTTVTTYPVHLSTTHSVASASTPTDLSISGVPQRIDKLISENQAIVESDWPKRFSRQNSKDSTSKESDSNAAAANIPTVVSNSVEILPRKRRGSGNGFSAQSLAKVPAVLQPTANPPVHQLMHVKPIESLREAVPSSAELLPLNLTAATTTAASTSYQSRRVSESHHPPPIQANSIKELWLNSCKQSAPAVSAVISTLPAAITKLSSSSQSVAPSAVGKTVHTEDLQEGSSSNGLPPFHPQNPEGSMIKELLLKHRMQERQAAANAVASLNSRLPSVTSVTAVPSGETPPAQNPHHVTKKPLLSTVVTAKPSEVKVSAFYNNYSLTFPEKSSLINFDLNRP